MKIKLPLLAALLSVAAATSLGACGSDSSSNAPSCNNNGMVDPGEQCDGLALNGQTCMSLLMAQTASGTLSCKSDCTFDTSMCTNGAGGGSGTGGNNGTGGS
ncbi:MAG TPA: hypothetical protein VHC69_08050 [Polyangiaceae bacterium]|nr:hypothetical protein [Polyangiaceae bacterium]